MAIHFAGVTRLRGKVLNAVLRTMRLERSSCCGFNMRYLRRMELAIRLEQERQWAPIWGKILEEEQHAGTFDSWDLDEDQITCEIYHC